MKKLLLIVFIVFLGTSAIINAQNTSEQLKQLENRLNEIDEEHKDLLKQIEELKLNKIIEDIKAIALPTYSDESEIIYHSAMALSYDEKHEQARWVVHMILPDIEKGNVSRTNDFREDPMIKNGSSTKEDYWYSGFDRGHLAPSADFRWSFKALSESYFYSNMAPQRPEFNRGKWSGLENLIRQYVLVNKEPVFVVTGGVLKDGLPYMETENRVNNVSIPEFFYKVVLDYSGNEKRGIGFIMPNAKCEYPVMSYAVTIDSVESFTGIDFFSALPDTEENLLEKKLNKDLWSSADEKGDVEPLSQKELPKKTFNTVQAKEFIGETATICGTVVSTKFNQKSGSTFINLDKKFPNQIFSATIWKADRANFSYVPEEELYGKKICIKGKITDYKGTPSVSINSENQIIFMDDDNEN